MHDDGQPEDPSRRRKSVNLVKMEEITIKLASPRILLWFVMAPFFDIDGLVCHAPHNGAAAEVRAASWSSLMAVLRGCTLVNREALLLIDANSRLGEAHGLHCGTHLPEACDDNTAPFLDALELGRLCTTSTFADYTSNNSQGSWVSNAGKLQRLDYVCAALSWCDDTINIGPSAEIDVATIKIDHLAAVVRFRHRVEVSKRTKPISRSLPYYKFALKDPPKRELFEQALLKSSIPRWDL